MPFGRRQPQLTPADFLMGAAEKGRELGHPSMEELQRMLFDMAGHMGEPSEGQALIEAVLTSDLSDHEAALAWVVEEATRVGILRKEYDTVREAVALGMRLAFKFETYLRTKGVIFLDVKATDLSRGQGYRHYRPLPGTAHLDIEEEFIAVGESFRRVRGAYGISTEFILSLKQKYEEGRYRPPLTLVVPTAVRDQASPPKSPVSSWSRCPNCEGDLKPVQDASECLSCRRIWCDPGRKPLLDQTGKLIGTEGRLPEDPEKGWDAVALYIRGPRPDVPPLPD